ncbi:hypothetical protein WR25_24226 [Diploscapter pachys]|uniref:Uncharacterized protein n=1 Tax=Diploscapter pachys TaxID=2018661 RepID=A0A2A2M341_9BILA|nr:hypothetical protein WR25_24226 [Diploscapter pachys]
MLCDGWSAARRKSRFVSPWRNYRARHYLPSPRTRSGFHRATGGRQEAPTTPLAAEWTPEQVRGDGVGGARVRPKQERRPLPGPPLLTPKQTASLLPRALRVFVIARRGRRLLAVDRLRRRQRIARVHRLVQPGVEPCVLVFRILFQTRVDGFVLPGILPRIAFLVACLFAVRRHRQAVERALIDPVRHPILL